MRLEALLRRASPAIRFCGHVVEDGTRVCDEAAKHGLEGIVSKAVDEPYRPGNRGVWVKTKALSRQDFFVVGWTDPQGSRPYLGSMLPGCYRDDGSLAYAGRAGVGKLRPLSTDRTPLCAPPQRNTRGWPLVLSRIHWVRPKLAAEVTYLTWPAEGLLRHVVYQGLREDKPAREVRRDG